MHCYNCGKEIVRAEEGITLDNLNWAHHECMVKPATRKHQYMFKDTPAHSGTWLELTTNIKLRVYDISNQVAMLVDPDTGDYCYVYWDEAAQCSNPYSSYADAAQACNAYIAHL